MRPNIVVEESLIFWLQIGNVHLFSKINRNLMNLRTDLSTNCSTGCRKRWIRWWESKTSQLSYRREPISKLLTIGRKKLTIRFPKISSNFTQWWTDFTWEIQFERISLFTGAIWPAIYYCPNWPTITPDPLIMMMGQWSIFHYWPTTHSCPNIC